MPSFEAGALAEDFAADFATGLLNPDLGPARVAGPHGKAARKRYNVYRNNVIVSLIDALAATFPATRRITGPDFFRAMARFHIRETPPTSPLLFEYGGDFPAFIEPYEHARAMPWLADVARIEKAWLEAYHAADAAPLAAEHLAAVAPDALGEVRFTPHPATRILRSQYPARTIFAANRDREPEAPIEVSGAEDTLITRPGLEVFVRQLPPGGAAFLSGLSDGATLATAVEVAMADSGEFDLVANLAGMIEAGVFTAIRGQD